MRLCAYKASLLVCRRYYFMYNTSLFVCISNHCVYKARIRIFKGVVVCVCVTGGVVSQKVVCEKRRCCMSV